MRVGIGALVTWDFAQPMFANSSYQEIGLHATFLAPTWLRTWAQRLCHQSNWSSWRTSLECQVPQQGQEMKMILDMELQQFFQEINYKRNASCRFCLWWLPFRKLQVEKMSPLNSLRMKRTRSGFPWPSTLWWSLLWPWLEEFSWRGVSRSFLKRHPSPFGRRVKSWRMMMRCRRAVLEMKFQHALNTFLNLYLFYLNQILLNLKNLQDTKKYKLLRRLNQQEFSLWMDPKMEMELEWWQFQKEEGEYQHQRWCQPVWFPNPLCRFHRLPKLLEEFLQPKQRKQSLWPSLGQSWGLLAMELSTTLVTAADFWRREELGFFVQLSFVKVAELWWNLKDVKSRWLVMIWRCELSLKRIMYQMAATTRPTWTPFCVALSATPGSEAAWVNQRSCGSSFSEVLLPDWLQKGGVQILSSLRFQAVFMWQVIWQEVVTCMTLSGESSNVGSSGAAFVQRAKKVPLHKSRSATWLWRFQYL